MKVDLFVKLLTKNRHLDILYNYHTEHATNKLSVMEFIKVVNHFSELMFRDELGQVLPAIDMDGVYKRVVGIYKEKFNVMGVVSNKGVFIKYVY